MKKLFILFAVASLGFVACNNESATEKTTDSVSAVVDSSASAKKDSIETVSDSAKAHVDSAASAMKDTLKK